MSFDPTGRFDPDIPDEFEWVRPNSLASHGNLMGQRAGFHRTVRHGLVRLLAVRTLPDTPCAAHCCAMATPRLLMCKSQRSARHCTPGTISQSSYDQTD